MSKNEYIPLCYKIPNVEDIFSTKSIVKYSRNIDYPKFSYGFHHYFHQNKDKMEITKQFKNKKKVYKVAFPFNKNIDDYDKSIVDIATNLFSNNKIVSSSVFKLWEILHMFPLVTNKTSSIHIDDDGSFAQSLFEYQTLYFKTNPKSTIVQIKNKHYNEHAKQISKKYANQVPIKQVDMDSLSNNKVDFITSNGGINWTNFDIQEQDALLLLLTHIYAMVNALKKEGNFVLKIYESFTQTTGKIILMLKSLFEHVYIVKPLTSDTSSSEKFIVCLNYTPQENKVKIIGNILKASIDQKEKGKRLVDIFSLYNISKEFLSTLIKCNIEFANNQYLIINRMVDFIEKENYRGEEYVDYRENQITASEYWTKLFFDKNNKKKIEELTQELANDNFKNGVSNIKNKLI